MFIKGKGSLVNLLCHLRELQHHLPEVGMWETILGHLLSFCLNVKARPGHSRGLCSPFSVIIREINVMGLMNCQLMFFV